MKTPLGTEVGLGPGHIVLDGDPAPPPRERGTADPSFGAHVYCCHGCPPQLLLSSCLKFKNPCALGHHWNGISAEQSVVWDVHPEGKVWTVLNFQIHHLSLRHLVAHKVECVCIMHSSEPSPLQQQKLSKLGFMTNCSTTTAQKRDGQTKKTVNFKLFHPPVIEKVRRIFVPPWLFQIRSIRCIGWAKNP